jgi:hypothetical protein
VRGGEAKQPSGESEGSEAKKNTTKIVRLPGKHPVKGARIRVRVSTVRVRVRVRVIKVKGRGKGTGTNRDKGKGKD